VEVELRVSALPEHEAGQTLLARSPDEEIRIGLAASVEMLRDVLDIEYLDEVLDARSLARVLLEQ
jgi:hypothetical protein